MKRIAAAAPLVVLGLATAVLALDVATVSAARVRFPFDLDWVEGGQLAHALRILEGKPIYGAADFLPHPYPPLHYAVLAAVGAVTGLSLTMARLVSVASWLFALAIGAGALYREGQRIPGGWWTKRSASMVIVVAGVGLSLRTYPYAHGWFDLARQDTMLAALVAGAAVLASLDRRAHAHAHAHAVTAGLVLAAAVFVKQTAIFFAVGLVLFVALQSRRGLFASVNARSRPVALALGFVVPSAVAFVWLDVQSAGAFHGWLASTGGHGIEVGRIFGGLWVVVEASPLLLAVPLMMWWARGRLGRASQVLVALWLAALPASLLPYAKMYGAHNNLIPLLLTSAVLPLSLALDAWRARGRAWPFSAVVAAATLLIVGGRFDTRRFAPNEEVTRAMAANLAEVKALPGTLACPVHPFLAHQVGKGPAQSSWLSFADAKTAGRPVDRDRYVADLIARGDDWIVLTNMPVEWDGALAAGIADAYVWDHNFSTPPPGQPTTFHSMPRMAFRRRAQR